jgi:hypothetical protein
MEDTHFTETEKSKISEVKCENDARCFFDARGIMHQEFVPPGQTVNRQFYLKVLKRLRDSVRKKDQKCGAAMIRSFTMAMPLPTRP